MIIIHGHDVGSILMSVQHSIGKLREPPLVVAGRVFGQPADDGSFYVFPRGVPFGLDLDEEGPDIMPLRIAGRLRRIVIPQLER